MTTSNSNIQIGDRVRSFDFDSHDLTGSRACYMEGTVVATGQFPEEDFSDSCKRYKIKVEKQIWGGIQVLENTVPDYIFPPVNGTRSSMGGTTDFVVRLEAGKSFSA